MHFQQAGLAHQLNAFRASFLTRLPEAERQSIDAAQNRIDRQLPDRVIPGKGDLAPGFELPDQHGRIVRLADRLSQGPVIVLFVRGGWCPFCTMTLRAYQAFLPAIHDAGGDLLAITPQPATTCSAMAERDLLAFETLSDQDNNVARSYGIAFETDTALQAIYERLGHDLPRINLTNNWTLPLAATFVIGQDRRVALAHVKAAVHQRLEPAVALAALKAIRVTA